MEFNKMDIPINNNKIMNPLLINRTNPKNLKKINNKTLKIIIKLKKTMNNNNNSKIKKQKNNKTINSVTLKKNNYPMLLMLTML